ncbi:cation transporter family protein [Brugia pahangi]|uniref:Acetylcholine receptor subunit alpha-type unc-63 n=1 Tax=Brugia pahangi TaxID=6280 RepID=A0A0N4TW45_BRUPA|nr:unnamed protein product [Brugia pahangi]
MVNLSELVAPVVSLMMSLVASLAYCNEDAKRLHDDLMANYNKHRRPAPAANKPITIKLKLRLSQIIDVHEIDQIMTCSVWLKQVWTDEKLSWNPKNYGGVSVLYVPYEMIWVPDIVLYNNADSNYNITISTKATLRYDGEVTWEPPAIFKSLCQIDVRWFPFDEQRCHFKFGSWTYSQDLLDLELLGGEPHYELEVSANGEVDNITIVDDGIDLSDYYPSVEWDIISRVAKRRTKNYASCCPDEAYIDIMIINLVFPCVGISFLTILVFYLPSHSGEKVTLCISILVTLTVFYLLLTEIIPATSISLPLIGKYLLFTMVMVTLSVIVTVISLNLHFRKPTTHRMPEWVKWFFLKALPKILFMRQPLSDVKDLSCKGEQITMNYHEHAVSRDDRSLILTEPDERIQKLYHSPHVVKAFENICFIAELLKKKDKDAKVDEDWKYVAMVLDRLFLLLLSIACFAGTITILLQAPTLYDTRQAIDLQYRPTNIT